MNILKALNRQITSPNTDAVVCIAGAVLLLVIALIPPFGWRTAYLGVAGHCYFFSMVGEHFGKLRPPKIRSAFRKSVKGSGMNIDVFCSVYFAYAVDKLDGVGFLPIVSDAIRRYLIEPKPPSPAPRPES